MLEPDGEAAALFSLGVVEPSLIVVHRGEQVEAPRHVEVVLAQRTQVEVERLAQQGFACGRGQGQESGHDADLGPDRWALL
jgi:hypothetical protein